MDVAWRAIARLTAALALAMLFAIFGGQRVRGGLTLYKTAAGDGSAVMDLVFFNNPYLPNQLQEGREYLFRGKMGGTLLRRQMSAPEFLPAGENLPVR